jgi:hypothetical protein
MATPNLHRRAIGPAGGTLHSSHEEAAAENDAILAELLKDVRDLKKASYTVQGEVKEHLTLTEQLSELLLNTRDRVKGAVGSVDHLGRSLTGVSAIWLLFGFAIIVCFFIYLLLRFRR